MELVLVTNTARSAVVELTEAGKYYSEKEYDIYVNGEHFAHTDKQITSLYGFKPDTEYEITAVYDGKEYGPVVSVSYTHLISVIFMWYLFMLIIVAGILLVVAKKEKLSIVTSVLATVVAFVSMFAFQFSSTDGKTNTGALKYVYHNVSDLLSNGYGGNTYSIGSGVYVIILGLIVAIIGVFWDVVKLFKKDLGVDSKYLSNSLNQSITQKMFYYRGFYIMFLPVFIMILLFFYWPMLGCRYAFTSYVLANPYYIGIFHFQTCLLYTSRCV